MTDWPMKTCSSSFQCNVLLSKKASLQKGCSKWFLILYACYVYLLNTSEVESDKKEGWRNYRTFFNLRWMPNLSNLVFKKSQTIFLRSSYKKGEKVNASVRKVVALSRNGHGKTMSTVPLVNWLPFYSGLLLGNLMIGNWLIILLGLSWLFYVQNRCWLNLVFIMDWRFVEEAKNRAWIGSRPYSVAFYDRISPNSCYLPDAAALFNMEAMSLCTHALASVALIQTQRK